MLVAFWSGPDRRERYHVREIECRDRWLADIAIDMAGQAPEPSLERVDALGNAGEVATLDHLLDEPQLLVCSARILVPYRDGGGDVGLPDQLGAKLLERCVGIHCFVVSVGIKERRGL